MGAFSAKFSTTPSGETMDGTRKSIGPKMMARTTSITVQNLVEIGGRTSAWDDEMWCFSLWFYFYFYVCNAPALNGHKWRSCVIEEKIASVFVGRFRCGLQRFFFEEKVFLTDETILKIVARWRYDWCANARGNFQNLRKRVQSLCAPLRPWEVIWKKTSTTALYPMYCRCAPI